MITTCGVFVYNLDSDQLLIVHPTNSSFIKWSIPKGELEKGEFPHKRALIELYEETNLDFKHLFVGSLGTVVYEKNKNKQLMGFSLLIRTYFLKGRVLGCNSMVDNDFPEIDGFAWVSLEMAEKFLHESQVKLLPKLRENIEYYSILHKQGNE